MSEEKGYRCPGCGCQDRMGRAKLSDEKPEEWRKIEGIWMKVPSKTIWDGPDFYYCPQCSKILVAHPAAVRKWMDEVREQ